MNLFEQLRARKKALEDMQAAMDEDDLKKVPGVEISIKTAKKKDEDDDEAMLGSLYR